MAWFSPENRRTEPPSVQAYGARVRSRSADARRWHHGRVLGRRRRDRQQQRARRARRLPARAPRRRRGRHPLRRGADRASTSTRSATDLDDGDARPTTSARSTPTRTPRRALARAAHGRRTSPASTRTLADGRFSPRVRARRAGRRPPPGAARRRASSTPPTARPRRDVEWAPAGRRRRARSRSASATPSGWRRGDAARACASCAWATARWRGSPPGRCTPPWAGGWYAELVTDGRIEAERLTMTLRRRRCLAPGRRAAAARGGVERPRRVDATAA